MFLDTTGDGLFPKELLADVFGMIREVENSGGSYGLWNREAEGFKREFVGTNQQLANVTISAKFNNQQKGVLIQDHVYKNGLGYEYLREQWRQQNLDNFQDGLDAVGLVPVIGEAADILNAGISYVRGDNVGAVLNLASAVPFLGYGAVAGKTGGSFWQGGKTFAQFKAAKGGTETLAKISTSTGTQRISTEFHHVFLTQHMQRAHGLPNWIVNNSVNVWKLKTVQHSLIDPYRYNFLRAGFKSEVGWNKRYNWFTKF